MMNISTALAILTTLCIAGLVVLASKRFRKHLKRSNKALEIMRHYYKCRGDHELVKGWVDESEKYEHYLVGSKKRSSD